jgi:forkhead transcription factor HCM1
VREVDLPPQGLPPGPRPVDKPSYSYAGLIGQAILSHPDRKLSLNAIYDWIIAAYPFYTKSEPGWMNSIRHNLSLNVCFVKRERDANGPVGKGNLWAIEQGAESQFANGGYKKK